eukprot:Mrub_08245.p1 GENE.Mrub_08245~~Mrub_08245.p1  ORF type:complete len:252 (+),score=43.26 Mrub_08245:1-756(+)
MDELINMVHYIIEDGLDQIKKIDTQKLIYGINTPMDEYNKMTPLLIAIKYKRTEIARYLITELQADVNKQDSRDNTPLHIAADNEDYYSILLLMINWAIIDKYNYYDLRPGEDNKRIWRFISRLHSERKCMKRFNEETIRTLADIFTVVDADAKGIVDFSKVNAFNSSLVSNKSMDEISQDTQAFLKRAAYCYPDKGEINVDEFVFAFARMAYLESYSDPDNINEENHKRIVQDWIKIVETKHERKIYRNV